MGERKHLRLPVRGWADLGRPEREPLQVHDLSLGGAHLVARSAMSAEPARAVTLEVLGQNVRVPARVVWTREVGAETHTGLCFEPMNRRAARSLAHMLAVAATRAPRALVLLVDRDRGEGARLAEMLWRHGWEIADVCTPLDALQVILRTEGGPRVVLLVDPAERVAELANFLAEEFPVVPRLTLVRGELTAAGTGGEVLPLGGPAEVARLCDRLAELTGAPPWTVTAPDPGRERAK